MAIIMPIAFGKSWLKAKLVTRRAKEPEEKNTTPGKINQFILVANKRNSKPIDIRLVHNDLII